MLPTVRSYEDSRRAFRWHIPEAFNAAADSLDRQCRPGADPDRTALVAPLADGTTAHFSYGALKRLSDLLAAAFAGRMLEPGACVATLLPQGLEMALSALAALKAGGVVAPMDAAWPPAGLAAAMAAAEPRIIVADRASLAVARRAAARLDPVPAVLCVSSPSDEAEDFWAALYGAPPVPVSASTNAGDPAFLVFSQGRTGPAKAILHAHRAVLGHLPGLEMVFEEIPRGGDMLWCAAEPAHPMGLISGLFGPWILGVPVLAMAAPATGAAAEACFAHIARHGVRLALFTPAAIDGLRRFPEPRAHYSFALRAAACVGGRPPQDADDWCRETLGLPLGRIYGEAETGPIAATHPHWFSGEGDAAIGRAIPGTVLGVVDADGQSVPIGAVGHVAVTQDHPGLCLGYEGQAAAVAQWARRKYVGRWFLTDDIASLDDDGNLSFVAKADDVLPAEQAGFLPDDVERVLAAHRMVEAAAVLALPDAAGNPEVVAAVVAKPGSGRGDAAAEALLAADILAAAAKSLAPYALPKRLIFVAEIPRTNENRVHRARLRGLLEKPSVSS
ncbi:AMP-binding protein [Oleispirillum naphthae]|uniref:AMP-binding protein n=1 Tax=Oleispirillum naphthae TaxID=2838853 RepID=UPI0030825BF3